MHYYHISNIKWDTDGEEVGLPSNVLVFSDIPLEEDAASDALSDAFGFCHHGYEMAEFDGLITMVEGKVRSSFGE